MLFSACEWLEHNSWIVAISRSVLLSIIVSVTHYFSFFCLVGSVIVVDLRILGVAGQKNGIKELADQLLPWMWVGLLLVIPSGFILFAGDATAFYFGGMFHIKIVLLVLA